jgi:hypothetical protein
MTNLIIRASLVLVLKAADCFTTALVILHGGAEGNPLIRYTIETIGLSKALSLWFAISVILLTSIILFVSIDKERYIRLATVGLQFLIILYSCVVLYNTFAYSMILGA